MRTPASRRVLSAGALLLLLATVGACRMNVEVGTTIRSDGSGTFRMVFEVDKDVVDLAKQAGGGEDPFAELKSLPPSLEESGWTMTQTVPGGGLRVEISRAFSSVGDLDRALRVFRERPAGREAGAVPSFLRDLTVSRSSGFLKTRTRVAGSVDLTLPSLFGEERTQRGAMQAFLSQSSAEMFAFKILVSMPGRVTSSTGVPHEVSGGTVVWTPRLGEKLEFSAAATGYNAGAVGMIAVPTALAIALAVLRAIRRRRRSAEQVPGWEVGTASAGAERGPSAQDREA